MTLKLYFKLIVAFLASPTKTRDIPWQDVNMVYSLLDAKHTLANGHRASGTAMAAEKTVDNIVFGYMDTYLL